MKNRDEEAVKALQYLLDEGFIVAGFKEGHPALFLTTELKEVHKAIKHRPEHLRYKVHEDADWWKNEKTQK